MGAPSVSERLAEFALGRTDLIFELIGAGCAANHVHDHVPLIQHCAYFGDVSAIKFLLSQGESLSSLGDNLGLGTAAYHGHWRLCKFLLEQGADVNLSEADSGETALHSAVSKTDRAVYDRVLQVLLSHGANPNCATKPGVETGAFMRDCRTKGETPLHRAAAFGEEDTIRMLLNAGAKIDAKDANGETPLSWGSWYGRPAPILRMLCYGEHRIHPKNRSMRENLLGDPKI